MTFHDLRHTFGALAIRAGVSPKTLQELMSHASFKVTMDTHGHLYDADKRSAMNDLDRVIGAARPIPAP